MLLFYNLWRQTTLPTPTNSHGREADDSVLQTWNRVGIAKELLEELPERKSLTRGPGGAGSGRKA